MHLEQLVELASRRLGHHERATRPMGDLLLLRQPKPSPLEASLYEPVICLILQGRKEVTIGEATLSFGPGECLLVTNELPVSSRITKAPYLALILKVDIAGVRKLYDEVGESASAR
jgi:hypothetical protein